MIADLCAKQHGSPLNELGKELLELGEPGEGYHIKLNVTNHEVDGVLPFSAAVSWKGSPIGAVYPGGGVLMESGEEQSTEEQVIEWLKSEGAEVPV